MIIMTSSLSKKLRSRNLVPMVSHLTAPGGSKMRDPENEVAQPRSQGPQDPGNEVRGCCCRGGFVLTQGLTVAINSCVLKFRRRSVSRLG